MRYVKVVMSKQEELHVSYETFYYHFASNKAKEQISKQVFQENKAREIFRKTNISYPLIRTRMCAYVCVRIGG